MNRGLIDVEFQKIVKRFFIGDVWFQKTKSIDCFKHLFANVIALNGFCQQLSYILNHEVRISVFLKLHAAQKSCLQCVWKSIK